MVTTFAILHNNKSFMPGGQGIEDTCLSQTHCACGASLPKPEGCTVGPIAYPDGKAARICLNCEREIELAYWKTTDRGELYLTHPKLSIGQCGDGTLTSACAGLSIPCRVKRINHNMARDAYFVTAVIAGRLFSGRCIGDTQVCRLRAAKIRYR